GRMRTPPALRNRHRELRGESRTGLDTFIERSVILSIHTAALSLRTPLAYPEKLPCPPQKHIKPSTPFGASNPRVSSQDSRASSATSASPKNSPRTRLSLR